MYENVTKGWGNVGKGGEENEEEREEEAEERETNAPIGALEEKLPDRQTYRRYHRELSLRKHEEEQEEGRRWRRRKSR